MKQIMNSVDETMAFGQNLGQDLVGGEVFELVGDVGAGKTSFVKGLARGLGVDDDVQSPSFTISRIYEGRDGLELHHYDFYRLNDAGIMRFEVSESIANPQAVTVIEWAETVQSVLPDYRTIVDIKLTSEENQRQIELTVVKNTTKDKQ